MVYPNEQYPGELEAMVIALRTDHENNPVVYEYCGRAADLLEACAKALEQPPRRAPRQPATRWVQIDLAYAQRD